MQILKGRGAPIDPILRAQAAPGLTLDVNTLERHPWKPLIFSGEPLMLLEGEGGDGGAGGGDGGKPPPAKTFTQEQLDAIVAKQRRDLEAKFGDYDQLKEAAGKVSELEKQLESIREEAELKGKSEAEKARIQLEKRMQQVEQRIAQAEKERDEATAKAEAAVKARLDVVKRHQLVGALQGAKVVPGALDDATDAMLRGAEIETDDDGNIKGITVAGGHFDKPAEAVAAFLKTKPYYQSHPGGGSGGTNPNGAPGAPANVQEMSFAQLAEVVANEGRQGG